MPDFAEIHAAVQWAVQALAQGQDPAVVLRVLWGVINKQ